MLIYNLRLDYIYTVKIIIVVLNVKLLYMSNVTNLW